MNIEEDCKWHPTNKQHPSSVWKKIQAGGSGWLPSHRHYYLLGENFEVLIIANRWGHSHNRKMQKQFYIHKKKTLAFAYITETSHSFPSVKPYAITIFLYILGLIKYSRLWLSWFHLQDDWLHQVCHCLLLKCSQSVVFHFQ